MTGMRSYLFAAALPLSILSSGASAQDVYRLSDEEIAEIESRPAMSPDAVLLLEEHDEGVPARRMQSELSIGVGSHGYFDVRGTTFIPLGSQGAAILSFRRTEFDAVPLRYFPGRGFDY